MKTNNEGSVPNEDLPVDPNEEGVDIVIEGENTEPDGDTGKSGRNPAEILAEADRKLEKAKMLEENAQLRNQANNQIPVAGPQPTPPTEAQIEAGLAEEARLVGYMTEDENGNPIPDVSRFKKVAQISAKVYHHQNQVIQKEVNDLKKTISEMKLSSSNPDFVNLKPEIDNVINNNPNLKALEGTISKSQLQALALDIVKANNKAKGNESGTRIITPNRPDVGSTLSNAKPKTVRLSKEDMDICRQGGISPQKYAQMKKGN